jgi:hypothetical protein
MKVKVGDWVTLRNAENRKQLGFGNCQVVEIGDVDGTPAAKILIGGEEFLVAQANLELQAGRL